MSPISPAVIVFLSEVIGQKDFIIINSDPKTTCFIWSRQNETEIHHKSMVRYNIRSFSVAQKQCLCIMTKCELYVVGSHSAMGLAFYYICLSADMNVLNSLET